MVVQAKSSDLVFTPIGNRVWVAMMESESISVTMLPDAIKIFHGENKLFGDLHDALQYITNLTGQRPLFKMDEETANTRSGCD
jgi:hypothetical protein